MMHHAVDGRRSGHRVCEDVLLLGEDQVGRDAQGPAFVAFGDEREEHLGLLCPLGQVARVVEEQDVEVVQLAPRGGAAGSASVATVRRSIRYAGHPARCFWESAQLERSVLLKTATGAFVH